MTPSLFEESAESVTANRKRGNEHYFRRLCARLGDGRQWRYTGECCELPHATGKCTCGHHGLKYLFTIENPTTRDTCIVGSVCIERFGEANPAMVAAIAADAERLEKAAAERLKAAREAEQRAELQAALDEYDRLAWALDEQLSQGAERYTYRDCFGKDNVGFRSVRRVSHDVWRQWHTADVAALRVFDRKPGRYPKRWKQYKAPHAFLKAIRGEIAIVQTLLQGRLFE